MNDLVTYTKSNKNKDFPLIIKYLKVSASQKLLSNSDESEYERSSLYQLVEL